jgi:hypothetical protein
MSKNRRIALHHAIALAVHESIRAENIVAEAQKFAVFLEDLPTLKVEAASGSFSDVDYESALCAVLNHSVMNLRKKNAQELLDCMPEANPANLTVNDVLHAGPRFLFDMGVTEKRRGKILEDLHAIADAYEVELSDVEEYASVLNPRWSNGHEDHLFNGDAAAAAPLSFKEAILQQREAEAASKPAEPIDGDKPRCGCPDHTPFTAEELPGVTIDRLDVTTDTTDLLSGRGINTVQDLVKAGPVALRGLPERDQLVLITFAKALDEQQKSDSFAAPGEEPAPALQEVEGYLGLPIDSFADITPEILADLQSKGVNCLRDLFENPMLIPGCLVYGMDNWLKLTSHLLTGLKAEIEERTGMTEPDREVLRAKIADLTRLMELAKATVALKGEPAAPNLREMLRRAAHTLEPVVIAGDSPEGQALLSMLRRRAGDPKATSGLVAVNSETDPALSSLLDTLFGGKKEPTKH